MTNAEIIRRMMMMGVMDKNGHIRWNEDSGYIDCWYKDNELHREDGPAVEFSSGNKYWHLNGKIIEVENNEQFLRLVKLKAFL